MKVIAVYSIKGGVGKTTSAVNLAGISARVGVRTLIWDLDPQAATTFYFRVEPKLRGGARKLLRGGRAIERFIRATDYDGLDLLPADFSNRNMELILGDSRKPKKRFFKRLRPLAEDYDHVYIDCPPGISLVSDAVFRAADALLLPMIPTPLSLRAADQLLDYLGPRAADRPRVMPFFTMVDRRKSLHRQIAGRTRLGRVPILAARIPYSSEVERMGVHREPLTESHPGVPASLAYETLWREFLEELGNRTTGATVSWFRF